MRNQKKATASSRIEQRAFRGSGASVTAFGLGLLQSIVQVPFLLHYVGVENYGIWLSALAFSAIILTPDLGFHAYVGNKLQACYLLDPKEAHQILGSALKYCRVASLVCVVSVTISLVIGALLWTNCLQNAFGLVSVLILQHFLSTSSLGLVIRLYAASGKYAKHVILQSVARLVQLLASLGAVSIFRSLESLVLSYAISGLICNLILESLVKREFRELSGIRKIGTVTRGYQLWISSLRNSAAIFADQASQNGLVVLLASLTNGAIVAQYTTLKTIVNALSSGVSIIHNPMLPELGRVLSSGDAIKTSEIRKTMYLTQGVLVLLGTLLIIVATPAFYQIWTKGALELNPVMLTCLLFAFSLRSIGAPIALILYVQNLTREQFYSATLRLLIPATFISCSTPETISWNLGLSFIMTELLALGINVVLARARQQSSGQALYPGVRWLGWELAQAGSILCILGSFAHLTAASLWLAGTGAAISITTLVRRWLLLNADTRSRLLALAN